MYYRFLNALRVTQPAIYSNALRVTQYVAGCVTHNALEAELSSRVRSCSFLLVNAL